MNIDLLAGIASVAMPPPRTPRPTVLCLDSGLGGLTVFREVRRLLAGADYVYAADDAAFPVGDWPETALLERVGRVVGILISRYRPDSSWSPATRSRPWCCRVFGPASTSPSWVPSQP